MATRLETPYSVRFSQRPTPVDLEFTGVAAMEALKPLKPLKRKEMRMYIITYQRYGGPFRGISRQHERFNSLEAARKAANERLKDRVALAKWGVSISIELDHLMEPETTPTAADGWLAEAKCWKAGGK